MIMDLEIQNLSLSYGNVSVLSHLNAQLKSGGIIGLLGPNGAGKTSLIKILTTLQKPTQGNVLLNGKSIIVSPDVIRGRLGYLPQQVPYFPYLTANEYLLYIASMKGIKRRHAIDKVNALLKEFILDKTGTKIIKNFSGGMKQRIGIISMLLDDPDVIIADEPSTGLDPEERVVLRNTLEALSRKKLVIISTHIVSDIEAVASQILVLNHGGFVYSGTPNRIIKACEGFVWESDVDREKQENFRTTACDSAGGMSSLVQGPEGVRIREITNKSKCKDAQLVTPNLEEAYLAVLKGIVSL